MKTAVATEPRAWIGCLACYNSGNLRGEWVDALEAGEFTTEQLHGGATSHEELWVFEHEGLYLSGECSPTEAQDIAEKLSAVADDMREALGLYADNYHQTVASVDIEEFEARFCGEWESFEAFCEHDIEANGLLRGAPELFVKYFDLERYAEDVEHDYTVLSTRSSNVYVFSD